MVVNWTNSAKQDLKDFIDNSHYGTEQSATQYILNLVEQANNLSIYPKMGKLFFYTKKCEIRQIIYEKHRILYYISSNAINIIAVIHTARDIQQKIKYIKNFFNK